MTREYYAEQLEALVIQTPTSTTAVNNALASLRNAVETRLEQLRKAVDTLGGDAQQILKDLGWGGVMTGQNWQPHFNFQIHLCKWSEITATAAPARLQYNRGIRKVKDSSGGITRDPDNRQLYPDNQDLDRYVGKYFYELFKADNAPLASVAAVLNQMEDECRETHRVIMSIDYYYDRPLTSLGLHKDTTGNSVFVGLHYDNETTILGPEYIYDFYPMPESKDRYHSPWSKDQNVPYWPTPVAEGLELARASLKETHGTDQDLMEATTMGEKGIVCFVDELIFHATPLTHKRSEDEKRTLFKAFNINGASYEQKKLTTKDTLRRRYSLADMSIQQATSRHNRRSFVRFWAMIEPKAWHV